MNHIYRLVWNELTRAWVAVAETARGRGKRGSRENGNGEQRCGNGLEHGCLLFQGIAGLTDRLTGLADHAEDLSDCGLNPF